MSQTTDDPRNGKTTQLVTELSRTDPDPSLFTIPPGYKIIDPKAQILP